nr:uncharacterized protein LOC124809757 [Hydra vulgaris]
MGGSCSSSCRGNKQRYKTPVVTYKLSEEAIDNSADTAISIPQIFIQNNSVFSIKDPSKCSCSYHSKVFVADTDNKTKCGSHEKISESETKSFSQSSNHFDSYLSNCMCQYHSSFSGMSFQNKEDRQHQNKEVKLNAKESTQNPAVLTNSAEIFYDAVGIS